MYIDIHSHIIPGIDDGAEDMTMALEMLRIASLDGTKHIVATPHFNPFSIPDNGNTSLDTNSIMNISELVRTKTLELSEHASNLEIDIRIYSGTEVLIHPDIPTLLENNSICTLNGSRYILIELPMYGKPIYMPDVLYQIQLMGFVPIITHPERYNEVVNDYMIVQRYVDRGMLVQINAGSLMGLFGRKVQKVAVKLIKNGLVHFIASDAHSIKGRLPKLSGAARMVEKKFGMEIMQRLFYYNGIAVLENSEVSPM